MTECIFCKIVNGEVPSQKVYEDDTTLAFLDIAPINKGHTLVVPKAHSERFTDADDSVLKDLIPKVKKIAIAVQKGSGCDGINIGINNDPAAGQVVFHTHVHVIPRFADDGLKTWPNTEYKEREMETYREKIEKAL